MHAKSQPVPLQVVFFGTPEFAQIILDRLNKTEYKPILVVSTQDEVSIEKLRAMNIDLIIVAAYGRILPKGILDLPKYGALNVHPSLLPKYRGPSPIQYAILNGDEKTGVSIIKMDEQIDHGPLLAQREFQILNSKFLNGPAKPTTPELSQALAVLGAELLIATLPKYTAGKITPQEQVHKDATYTKIITKEDGYINWSKSAAEIERQVRAFTPWPGSYFFWKDKGIQIISGLVSPSPEYGDFFVGQAFIDTNKNFAVQTGNGAFIIKELQIQGKTKIAAKAFLNGYGDIIGSTLL